MAAPIKLDEYTNLSGMFSDVQWENTLLQDLGFFASKPSETQIISVDVLEDDAREVTTSVARYSGEMSALNFAKPGTTVIQAPLHVASTTITAGDWQGKRVAGTDRQKTALDCVTEVGMKHNRQIVTDREYAMAQSLFHNEVEAAHVEGGNIDWQDFWGIQQPTFELNLGINAKGDAEMSRLSAFLKSQLKGWSRSIKQQWLFASPELFAAIQENNTLWQMALYGRINQTINFPDAVKQFEVIRVGSINVIQIDDPLYGIAAGEGYFTASFSNIIEGDTSPFTTYNTHASRHAAVAEGSILPQYQYVLRDKFMNYEQIYEVSQIHVPLRPDFVVNVTFNTDATA